MLSMQHLRRHIHRSTDKLRVNLLLAGEMLRIAEVDQFYLGIIFSFFEKNVLRLDITVHDIIIVAEVHCRK